MVNLWLTLGPLYGITQAIIVGTHSHRIWKYMHYSVNKIDLNNDGTSVTLHFGKTGSSMQANIRDIKKQEHEKSFVETYEDSSLFPL